MARIAVALGIAAGLLLTGCTPVQDPAGFQPVGPNPSITPEPALVTLLKGVCADATEINTLVRLPDMQITGMEPGVDPISADEWTLSIAEAKDRAVALLRTDPGTYNTEIVDFATAVLEVSETPPTAPLPVDWHADLTAASEGLAAECEAVGMGVGVVLPSSFGG
jgi:hypothetical protein